MISWSLNQHPFVAHIGDYIDTLCTDSKMTYHLILPPLYTLCNAKSMIPLPYIFRAAKDAPNILTQIADSGKIIKLEEGFEAVRGFNWKHLEDLGCRPITGMKGFIMAHEVLTDIYDPVQMSRLCTDVLNAYLDATEAMKFLMERAERDPLKSVMDHVLGEFSAANDISVDELEIHVNRMHDLMNEAAEIIFRNPDALLLPYSVRTKLNFLIFNAISHRCHRTLLVAYRKKYAEEDKTAQRSWRNVKTVAHDNVKMAVAAMHLSKLLAKTSPADQIYDVTRFFDGVVDALPGVDIAADDILPAVCMAMAKEAGLASNVMSTFQYLADIWPPQGLDDKIGYVLTTCSIAATYLASGVSEAQESSPPIQQSSTDKTIDALEQLLLNL